VENKKQIPCTWGTTGNGNRQFQSGPLGLKRKSTRLPTKKDGRMDQTGNLEKDTI
jgi:hypothetical protein